MQSLATGQRLKGFRTFSPFYCTPRRGDYFDSTFKRVFILLYTEFFLHDPLSVRENSNFLTIFFLYTIIKTVCVGLFPRISRVGKRHKRSTCFYTDMLMAIYDEYFDPAYALEA